MAVEDIRKQQDAMWFTGHRSEEKRSGTIVALFREKTVKPLLYGLEDTISEPVPFPEL
jgi:hypothetical protein